MKYNSQMVVADCENFLGSQLSANCADLIVADPPYNIDQDYESYDDNIPETEYLAWTRRWLASARDVLTDRGSIWLFLPWTLVDDVSVMCRRELGFKLHDRVVWYYTFGVAQANKLSRSHAYILHLAKAGAKPIFNGDEVRVPSARAAVYKDTRANPKGRLPDNLWVLHQEALAPLFPTGHDAWLQSRVCGTFKERRKHSPNQLPVPLVERIVRLSSNIGSLVVDPFLGSGTTGYVCSRLQRHFSGCDIDKTCVEQSQQRVKAKH